MGRVLERRFFAWFSTGGACRRLLLALLVALAFAHLAESVGVARAADADAGAAPVGTDAGASKTAWQQVQAELGAAESLLAGELAADMTLSELLGIKDPNEARQAVRSRLAHDLGAARHALDEAKRDARSLADGGADGGDAGAGAADAQVPAADFSLAMARLDLLEKKVKIARLSDDAWQKLRKLEAERAKRREREQSADAERLAAERAQSEAEAARRKALAEADASRTTGDRRLAEELARLQGVRGAQAKFRGELSTERSQVRTADEARKKQVDALVFEADAIGEASKRADALFDRMVESLGQIRDAMDESLAQYGEVDEAPRYGGDLASIATTGGDQAKRRKELRALADKLEESADSLDEEAHELAWQRIEHAANDEKRLNTARIALMDRLTSDKRALVLGFGEEGIDQLRREVRHLRISTRWLVIQSRRLAETNYDGLRDPVVLGAFATKTLILLALMFGAAWVTRNGKKGLTRLRALLVVAVKRPRYARPLQWFTGALDALYRELVLLVAVLIVPGLSTVRVDHGVLAIIYGVFLWYAWYRVALAGAHRTLAWMVTTGKAKIDEERSAKLLSTVRVVGRYAFAVAVILGGSAAVLGRGYLYHLVARFAWLGAIPIAMVLVRRWRGDITDAYLSARGKGALARAVEHTRNRWYGFAVVIAAFSVLTVAALTRVTRRFVLGFEHVRRALAYLFRKRLERRAEESVRAEDAGPLPRALTDHFVGEPVDTEPYAIERFPGLEATVADFARWKDRGGVGAVLLVARSGYGKTSWLTALRKEITVAPVTLVELRRRETSAGGAVRTLAEALSAPTEAAIDDRALADWLRAEPSRVIVIDDVHLWFLRSVGQMAAFEALGRMIERTSGHVFWVVSCGHYPFSFLRWTWKSSGVFRRVVELDGWTESDITELLSARMAASGWEASYEDLVVDKLEGVEGEAQLLGTARDYNRLIWDYAEGSPRAALHCWLASLTVSGPKTVRVRLFRGPDSNELEVLPDRVKFVLGAIVWHERASIDDLERSLRYSRFGCQDAVGRLLDMGVIEQRGDLVTVTTRWWPVVIRYLRRKHMIET